MKKNAFFASLSIAAVMLIGMAYSLRPRSSMYEPIYKTRQEVQMTLNGIKPARPLKNTGKIYTKGNFIYIAEKEAGIHIIDNSSPISPRNIGFIELVGNHDIAIRGDMMYLDCQYDLVVYSLNTFQIVKWVDNVFFDRYGQSIENYLRAPDGITVRVDYSRGVFAGWKRR